MVQSSPLLTEDDELPLPDDLRNYLDEHYFAQLPYLDVVHPKLLILFSGGNAVGKSTLSKVLQSEFHGLVIENDAVRTAIRAPGAPQYGQADDYATFASLTWAYIQDLYGRVDSLTDNGLIIRDAVVDWYFDRILPIFEQKGYTLLVVRFELSRAKRIELLRARGGKEWISAERMEMLLDDHDKHAKRFLAHYTPDVTLGDDDLFDYQKVIDAVRSKLSMLS